MHEYPEGATPLDPDEAEGLLPKHITTRDQLNQWEQANILEAEKWISGRNFHIENIITMEFIKNLHRRMFGKTWSWAGSFRKSNKNIGVEWYVITSDLSILMDDVLYQAKNSVYPAGELAVRFHHRLVSIHLFPNGNGRHARLMADILLLSQGESRFPWGKTPTSGDISPVRKQYILALRAADRMDYLPLMNFSKGN